MRAAAIILLLVAEAATAQDRVLLRCVGKSAVTVTDKGPQDSAEARRHLLRFQPTLIDGVSGEVRGADGLVERWKIRRRGDAEDLVLSSPDDDQRIQIRHWQTPILFVSSARPAILVSGLCEVAR